MTSEFIETPGKSYSKPKIKTIKIKQEKTDMNKDQFQKAKADHKASIAKIKLSRKQEKQDIKRHRMLIKQAKITYKLTQMKASK